MSIVEIHHTDGDDADTTRLRAVLNGRALADFDLRWSDRAPAPSEAPGGWVEIRRLAVGPETRSRGVVGRLFDRLAALGRERGIRRVVVTVHHAAVDACTAIGFRATGEAFWDGARRFVPMSLDLTTWSSIRGRHGAVHAIGCLARPGIVHSPVAGASVPDEPSVATA